MTHEEYEIQKDRVKEYEHLDKLIDSLESTLDNLETATNLFTYDKKTDSPVQPIIDAGEEADLIGLTTDLVSDMCLFGARVIKDEIRQLELNKEDI